MAMVKAMDRLGNYLEHVKVVSGKFTCGVDCDIGKDVVIDVAEEVVVGDRCVLAAGTYLGGRRVTLGDDFFGYDWSRFGRALDVGRGRRDDEDAVLTVGGRCVFHDNRIDLARAVTVGDDVGFSPEVVVYTHGYWGSVLEGFPCRFEGVRVGAGTLVGFRSTLLAGTRVGPRSVVGAGSVCAGLYPGNAVYAGNPARRIKDVEEPTLAGRASLFDRVMREYGETLKYRRLSADLNWDFPEVKVNWPERCVINVVAGTLTGEEGPKSDDLRWHLFTRGIRVYTRRPFRKLEKR
jgi:acetyltransferase-like isoleucine patch superfamily enzyme